MKLYIGCDHRGIELKDKIINHLEENGLTVEDIGLPNTSQDDYPKFAFRLGDLVIENPNTLGILICGSGIGMSIAANKVKGIRCVRATNSSDAFTGKNHNGANVIAVGIDSTPNINEMYEIIDTFINTKNPCEERHLNRVKLITDYEETKWK